MAPCSLRSQAAMTDPDNTRLGAQPQDQSSTEPWPRNQAISASSSSSSAQISGERASVQPGFQPGFDPNRNVHGKGRRRMSVKTRMVLHYQLRGFSNPEIAQELGVREQQISQLVCSRRYQKELNDKLDEVDNELLRQKPLAARALRAALNSRDEAIGLKAAETWFRTHGFKGFARGPDTQINVHVTAEDLALQIIHQTAARSSAAPGERDSDGEGS